MNRYTVLFVSTLLLRCIAGAVQLLAQSQGPFPPDSPDCRYLDDYRYLDSLEERNFYECLKYCPVGRRSSFSFGGESRFLYLNFSHYQLTDKQEDPNGYVLQRYLLHGDFRYGNWFRVFSQFQYTDSHWRTGGSLLIDHDALELHQLFIGLSAELGGSILQLNMGRREYSFGNQRWLSAREGPNTRISFDGLNLKLKSGFVLDFFLLAPVALGPESFDARADWNQKRIGFHFNKPSRSQNHELNLYGLWFETITSRPNSGAIPRKAALGLRDVLTGKSYEIDAEIMLQFARVRGRLMHAYLAGINASYLPPLAKERVLRSGWMHSIPADVAVKTG
ncbi:MAG: hypothetical protein CSA96_03695 [Bacteroidetes bacterium]|nr:MAG: hypothetical protein CSA96_03695 [Bacteroidota bacterium]